MQKIQQQRYKTMSGEIKVNCYKITLSKEVVRQAGFNEETKLKVRAENGKIIIENGEKNEKRWRNIWFVICIS